MSQSLLSQREPGKLLLRCASCLPTFLLSASCNAPCPYPHRYLLFYVEYAVQDKPDSLSPEAAVRRGGDACA
jgi:hypothetical protein